MLLLRVERYHVKYGWVCKRFMEEEDERYEPVHLNEAEIGLGRLKTLEREINALRNNDFSEFYFFASLVRQYKGSGYNNICLLLMGASPEERKKLA